MLVKILKYWNDFDILQQTPGGSGEWRGVKFVADQPGEADYVIISGYAGGTCQVVCPPENVWLFMAEPPNEVHKKWHHPPKWFSRVYTTDDTVVSKRHFLARPILPWHVGRSYDFLTSCPKPEKTGQLSWITSNRSDTVGHIKRLEVIKHLQQLPELDLYGRGFNPIVDKWDGLAPYRYSVAYENFSNANYWTEKVKDCFLSWAMPLYYGCTELERFFPKRSFVRINPDASDLAERVSDIINSNLWQENADAIEEARDLVLHKYNFFEFAVQEIENHRSEAKRKKRPITIYNHCMPSNEIEKSKMSFLVQQNAPGLYSLLKSYKQGRRP